MFVCHVWYTHLCHPPLPWFWTCHMLMQWLGIIRTILTQAVGSMQQCATSKCCLCPHVHVLFPTSLQLSFQAHKNAAYSVCVKPDTGFIVTGGEGNMYIWGEWMGEWRLPPRGSGSGFFWYTEGSGNYAWRRDVDEHIHSRINQSIATDYRLFQPRLSKAYRAKTSSNLIDWLIRNYASSLTSSCTCHKLNNMKKWKAK